MSTAKDTTTETGHRIIETEVTWKSNNYILGEQLSNNELGKEIGIVDDSRITNCSNCGTPVVVKGNKLYEIKGIDVNKAIAAEIHDGKYYVRLNNRQQ